MSPAVSPHGPHHPRELAFSKLKKIATSLHHEPQPLPLVPNLSSSDRSSSCVAITSSTPVRSHVRAASISFHLTSALSLSIQSREATTSGAKARRGYQGGSARCRGALRRCSSTGGGAEVRPRSTLRAARLSVSSGATGMSAQRTAAAWRRPHRRAAALHVMWRLFLKRHHASPGGGDRQLQHLFFLGTVSSGEDAWPARWAGYSWPTRELRRGTHGFARPPTPSTPRPPPLPGGGWGKKFILARRPRGERGGDRDSRENGIRER